MGRAEDRIFKLNDEIASLERELHLVREELVFHQHLNDDAQRDAAVSGHPIDRADARDTAGDVTRFERSIAKLEQKIAKLDAKRAKLIEKL